jgi:prevent-host-death family protein
MSTVNVHDAKTNLSRYLEEVSQGEEIIIARAGRPVARLVPVEPTPVRRFGVLKGRICVPDNFNAPLPDDVIDLFEGKA